MKKPLFTKFHEDGQALIFVMLMLFIITYVIMAVLVRRSQDVTVTHGQANSTEALALANSGISDMETLIGTKGPLASKAVPFTSGCVINNTVSSATCDSTVVAPTKFTNSMSTICNSFHSTNCSYNVTVNSLTSANYYGTIVPVSLKYNGASCANTSTTCSIGISDVVYGTDHASMRSIFISFGDDAGDYFQPVFVNLQSGNAVVQIPHGIYDNTIYPTEAQITFFDPVTVIIDVGQG